MTKAKSIISILTFIFDLKETLVLKVNLEVYTIYIYILICKIMRRDEYNHGLSDLYSRQTDRWIGKQTRQTQNVLHPYYDVSF